MTAFTQDYRESFGSTTESEQSNCAASLSPHEIEKRLGSVDWNARARNYLAVFEDSDAPVVSGKFERHLF